MRTALPGSVIILTDATMKRRLAHYLAVFLLGIHGTTAVAQTSATQWHPVEDIRSAAEQFLKTSIAPSDDRLVPTAGFLDARLHLPRCTQALEPYVLPGARLSGRITVGVRCGGLKPWKVYLPVYVAVIEEVQITRRALPRGHLIRAEDIEVEARDVSGLMSGYLSSSRDIVGHRLSQSISKGVVIIPSVLREDVLVRKGQLVTLAVQGDTINISMSGKALADGTVNQRIKVENSGSGRVVEGVVRSAGLVEVLLQ